MKKLIYNFVIVILLLSVLIINVSAEPTYDTFFTFEDADEEYTQRMLDIINLKVINEEPNIVKIKRFAVRDDGGYAVCEDPFTTNYYISVYSADGTFEYAYYFSHIGRFDIEFEGENIVFVRSPGDLIISFDPEGNLVFCKENVDVKDSDIDTFNKEYIQTSKMVGNSTYKLANDSAIFWIINGGFSKLIKIDENGNETVLFKGEYISSFAKGTIIRVVLTYACAGVVFGLVFVIVFFIKRKKRQGTVSVKTRRCKS